MSQPPTIKDFISQIPFFKYKDKECLLNFPPELLSALDSPKFPYYILQGSWGVGKSTDLIILKGLIEIYIKKYNIRDLIVLYVQDATVRFTDELIDTLQSHLSEPYPEPSRMMHLLLKKKDYKKILLIDMWPGKEGNDEIDAYYRFTRPIQNLEQFRDNRVTQIVAGSGSWKFNSMDERLVIRYLIADNIVSSGIWKIVDIKPLDIETVTTYVSHRLPATTVDISHLLKLTGGIFYFVDIYANLLQDEVPDIDKAFSKKAGLFACRKLYNLKENKRSTIGLILNMLYTGVTASISSVALWDLNLVDENGTLLASYERGLLQLLQDTTILDVLQGVLGTVSTHLFEASFVPLYIKDLISNSLDLKLIYFVKRQSQEKEGPPQKKTKYAIVEDASVNLQIIDSKCLYNNRDLEGTFQNWCDTNSASQNIASKNTFYFLPPRFRAIDAFLVVDDFVYAFQISCSSYTAHASKREDLSKKIPAKKVKDPATSNSSAISSDIYLSIGDNVNQFLLRATGLKKVSNIRYVYCSPECHKKDKVWELEPEWVDEACKLNNSLRILCSASGLK
eukprot:NODE_53_length_30760_cov_1.203712.p6 type:complete len:564 gc:universal NODE_53_length_30760_cov_1.203712:13138-11447(-)